VGGPHACADGGDGAEVVINACGGGADVRGDVGKHGGDEVEVGAVKGEGDIARAALHLVTPMLPAIAAHVGATATRVDDHLCTVSAVGAGMRTAHGVAAAMFDALARAGILVENICTSEVRISAVMNADLGPTAVRCLHQAFGLHSQATEALAAGQLTGRRETPATELKPSTTSAATSSAATTSAALTHALR